MAQSHVALRAFAARQDEDIRAARCGGFFPTPALSLGERVNPSHRGEQSRPAGFPLGDARCSLSLRESMCLALKPSVGQGRGIYPAGTPALQIRVGEFQGPFATQPSCGLKSALRSLAQ